MKQYLPRYSDKPFPFYLRRSTYIHAALVLLTLSGSKVAFEFAQKQREANLELLQASVRVDMVAMPTHTLNELKNMSSGVEEAKKEEPATAPEKTEEKPAEKVEEKPVEEKPVEKVAEKDPVEALEEAKEAKRVDFLSKLKKIAGKKIESEGNVKAEKGLYGEKSTDLKNLVLSGNKLSKGTQMYGDGPAGNLTAFQSYKLSVLQKVKPHWKLPSYLLDKKLRCVVRIWVNRDGSLARSAIHISSGDPEYDQRAMESVRAATFPEVTEELGNRPQNGEILLGFPL